MAIGASEPTPANAAPLVVTDVVIIGAGPGGLAVASRLIERGLAVEVLERHSAVGSAWRGHYDRLHLHTIRELSALPGLPFDPELPRYVPRAAVVEYLEGYAARFGIRPRFGEAALSIVRHPEGGWLTTTEQGSRFLAQGVVVASGANQTPVVPALAGRDEFRGRVVHSRDYRGAAPFAAEHVLVVGMGNTGAEIALDLTEHAVDTTISVRSPVNIIPRDVLGWPSQRTAMTLARLPPRWADAIARRTQDLTVGDLRRWGIERPAISPIRQLLELGKTPVIDVGTLARIRAGEIRVKPGIERLTPEGVRFVDGSEAPFDSVVLATGYRADVQRLFPETPIPSDARGLPDETIGRGVRAGLAFVGFDLKAGGVLRRIGLQAETVAAALATQRRGAGFSTAPPDEASPKPRSG